MATLASFSQDIHGPVLLSATPPHGIPGKHRMQGLRKRPRDPRDDSVASASTTASFQVAVSSLPPIQRTPQCVLSPEVPVPSLAASDYQLYFAPGTDKASKPFRQPANRALDASSHLGPKITSSPTKVALDTPQVNPSVGLKSEFAAPASAAPSQPLVSSFRMPTMTTPAMPIVPRRALFRDGQGDADGIEESAIVDTDFMAEKPSACDGAGAVQDVGCGLPAVQTLTLPNLGAARKRPTLAKRGAATSAAKKM